MMKGSHSMCDNEGNGALNIAFGSLLINQQRLKAGFEYLFNYTPGLACIENNRAENMVPIAANKIWRWRDVVVAFYKGICT